MGRCRRHRLARVFLPAVLWAGGLFLSSSIPGGTLGAPPFPGADKLVHAAVFGVLAALLVRGFTRGTAFRPRVAFAAGFALAVLYGGFDELHQAFVPGRQPDAVDLLADAAGALVGALAVAARARGETR